MYMAKLLESTKADRDNSILKNTTIAVPLKYLSNFWRSRKIPLINYKVELKLIWAKYQVLSVASADNTNANPDFYFYLKNMNLYVPIVT